MNDQAIPFSKSKKTLIPRWALQEQGIPIFLLVYLVFIFGLMDGQIKIAKQKIMGYGIDEACKLGINSFPFSFCVKLHKKSKRM